MKKSWKIILLCSYGLLVLTGLAIFILHYDRSDKYCYAFFAPHGGYWQDVCFATRDECDQELSVQAEFRTLNTRRCYGYKTTDAYCVSGVLTGGVRYDDYDGTKIPERTTVCTIKLSTCNEMRKYLAPGYEQNKCQLHNVPTRESEGLYLTPTSKIETIIRVHE